MPSSFEETLRPTIESRKRQITRRGFLAAAAASLPLLGLYSNEVARHLIDITNRTFFIRRLPPAFEGFRFVQISDIHLEEFAEDYFLRRVVDHINRLAPDLVLITGDYVSRGPLPTRFALAAASRCGELLDNLTCPLRFGVLGNHDGAVGARDVRARLEGNGTPLLVNEHVAIERGGDRIWLAGTDEASESEPNLDLAIPEHPDAPVILMAHEPDFVDHVLTHKRAPLIDLMLSGHTHGGQVRIPGLRPLSLPPLGKIYPEGHYLLNDLQLYVNRGIGTVGLPLRLNCPPEITVATLRRALD